MVCVISTDPLKEALEDGKFKYLMFFCLSLIINAAPSLEMTNHTISTHDKRNKHS